MSWSGFPPSGSSHRYDRDRMARRKRYLQKKKRAGGCRGLAVTLVAVVLVLIVAGALGAGASVRTPASPPASPTAGVPKYLTAECGLNTFVPVNLADPVTHRTSGNYFYFRTGQTGHDCVRAEDGSDGNLSGYVPSRTWGGQPTTRWDMPFIQAGWYWGSYTCAHRSSQGRASTCQWFPVELDNDGVPVTSAEVFPHEASGNTAYDMWFTRNYGVPALDTSQNQDAEVMIWMNHPGIPLSNYARAHLYTTWVGGSQYYVMGWTAGLGIGHPWLYTAYIAVKQTDRLPATYLNEFFRDASAHGRLAMSWWLTAVDFGGEMNLDPVWACVKGIPCMWAPSGTGFAVKRYSLSGLPDNANRAVQKCCSAASRKSYTLGA